MDFVRPVTIQILVGWQTMADSVERILIRTGTDFETEVEESLRIVLRVTTLVGARQRAESARVSMWTLIHPHLIVIGGVRIKP